eukprot:GHVU01014802.1.p1 GENE.GHVU01014802.1~~GHVU01014802.1.p1  ORF type:complete len:505 (+),score=7.19 GHVU01014802.1:889-2403(+)
MQDTNLSVHCQQMLEVRGNSSISLGLQQECPLAAERAQHDGKIVKNVLVASLLTCVAVSAMVGNVLVILAVYKNRRLRTITNCYVVSLATSDLLVSTLVLPLSIVVEVTGKWYFGIILCEFWISADVMLCTASILNLCCISVDRYFAITDPLVYATKRSKRLALIMIAFVWVAAIVITCPPIFGWQEEGRWDGDNNGNCHYIEDTGYRIYSALGSFYLPLLIMIFVYCRIFQVARNRQQRLKPFKRKWRSPEPKLKLRQQDSNCAEEHCLTEVGKPCKDTAITITETSLTQPESMTQIGTGKCVSIRKVPDGLVISPSLGVRSISFPKRQADRETSPSLGERNKLKKQNMNRFDHDGHVPSSQPRSSGESDSGSPVSERQSNEKPGSGDSQKHDRRRIRQALLKERKTAKTLSIVVGGFVICWLPFFLMYIIEPFCKSCSISPIMASIFTWLGYFNSVINPFIYAFYNRDFRHTFWSLTLGQCQKKEDNSLRYSHTFQTTVRRV